MPPVWTLLWLLVYVVVIGVVIWIVRMLPLPHPWNVIAQAVVAVIGFILVITWLMGVIGPPPAAAMLAG